MFGQQTNTPFGGGGGGFGQQQQQPPPFGSPSAAPGGLFGTPAPAPFGAPAPAPFGGGGGGGFGAPAAPAPFGGGGGGFGQPAPAPAGGGLFGQPAPAPSVFGGSTFGQPAPAPFGAPAPGPGLFGAPAAPFGTPAPAPGGGGLFGNTSSMPFGGGNTTSTFGAPASSTGFGGGGGGFGNTTSTFGAPAPAAGGGGLFGNNPAPAPAYGSTFGQPAPAPFGAPAPSPGLFGQPPSPAPAFGAAPTPVGGGMFGAPAANMAGGTRGTPWSMTSKQDGTGTSATSINLYAISAMPPYENKSFEELRAEDYAQGNRGSSITPTASNAAGGAFFSSPAPASSTGLFGQPAPAFGGSTFGAPAPATGGLFGQQPAPAPFGSAAPPPSLFGQQSAPAPQTGFGSTSAFGAPAPSTGGLFGQPPAPAPFGAPAPGTGLFGSTPAPAFGGTSTFGGSAPAPSSTGLFGQQPAPAPFGAPAPAQGLFGQQPAPAPFGAAPTTGLFGSMPAPAPFGGFGAPAPASGSGLFGSTAPAPGFGSFGAPAPAPLFGATAPSPFGAAPSPWGSPPPYQPQYAPQMQQQQPPQQQPILPPNAQIIPPATNEILMQQMRALNESAQNLERSQVWGSGGGSGSKSATTPVGTNGGSDYLWETLASADHRSSFMSPSFASPSPRSSAQIRPRGMFPRSTPDLVRTSGSIVKRTPAARNGGLTPGSYFRSPTNHLHINPESLSGKPKLRHEGKTPIRRENGNVNETLTSPPPDDSSPSPAAAAAARSTHAASRDSVHASQAPPDASGQDYYQSVIGTASPAVMATTPAAARVGAVDSAAPPTYVPKLTKKGYHVQPPLSDLAALPEAELAAVRRFSIERPGFGKIEWDGAVDVRGADLDRSIVIDVLEVNVYSEEEGAGTKPEEGSKLNRPAKITYCDVFPKDGGAEASDEAKDKLVRKFRKQLERLGADFVSYDKHTGLFVMRVQHFSRWKLQEDDSDDESDGKDVAATKSVSFEPGASPLVPKPRLKRRATPYKSSLRLAASMGDISESAADDDDDANIVSDVDMTEVEMHKAMQDRASQAYSEVSEMLKAAPKSKQVAIPIPNFADEGSLEYETIGDARAPSLPLIDVNKSRYSRSKLRNLAIEKASTDCAAFAPATRVGWSPLTTCFRGVVNAPPQVTTVPRLLAFEGARELFSIVLTKADLLRHDSGCRMFAVPKQPRVLWEMASTFAQSQARNGEVQTAFLLISNMADCSSLPLNRQNAAALACLVKSCAAEVDEEIRDAQSRNAIDDGVFAALASGDVEKACDVAAAGGLFQLAAVLATDSRGRRDLAKQLAAWADNAAGDKVSLSVKRALQGICGKDTLESRLQKSGGGLDWRRRLALRLLQNPHASPADVLDRYVQDVAAGVAPPAWSVHGPKNARHESILYRVMQVAAGHPMPVASIVHPNGFTAHSEDTLLSFFLAVCLASSGLADVTPLEEAQLVSGCIAQLVSSGHWPWAVACQLCVLSSDPSPEQLAWRVRGAKELVLRHYNSADVHAQLHKDVLLSRVAVPPSWLDEAVGMRALARGDVANGLIHQLNYHPLKAMEVVESKHLPHLFYTRSAKDFEKTMAELSVLMECEDGSPLASAMHAFLDVARKFEQVDDKVDAYPFLAQELVNVAATMQAQLEDWNSSASARTDALDAAPTAANMVAESVEYVKWIQLQLRSKMLAASLAQPIALGNRRRLTDQLAWLEQS